MEKGAKKLKKISSPSGEERQQWSVLSYRSMVTYLSEATRNLYLTLDRNSANIPAERVGYEAGIPNVRRIASPIQAAILQIGSVLG